MCSGPASRAISARPATAGPGYCGGPDGGRAEFITMSLWESLTAIEGFAGLDIEKAVFYPEDDQFLIERDLTVCHYEVADTE
jgi:hypothetical protein